MLALRHRNLNWLIMAPYIWIKSNIYQGSSECFIESIETGLVTRSDSHRLIPVRFRLITCTRSSYVSTCNKGFSRQLYYEISMNEIEIPPLRKRREDLKQMIDDIIDKYQERTRKK